MSAPAIFLWAIVFVVGVPSAWRNPTAGALVLAKIAGWVIYHLTGNNLPTEYYPYVDAFVIAIIFSKPECRASWCSPSDKIVLLIFALMWVIYVAPMDAFYRWWLLYTGVVFQFLFASAESLEIFWQGRSIVKRHLGDFNHSFFAAFNGTHPVFLPRAAECAFISATGASGDG
jgi:hypothetical protein